VNGRSSKNPASSPEGFRHAAFLYQGRDSFLSGVVPFITDGLSHGEAVLVVLEAAKIDLLRAELGRDADGVEFADMAKVGLNPARIIPAWRHFVQDNSRQGRAMRGVGEPIWPARTAAELAESHHHEALLNPAFTAAKQFWLLCPYDTEALAADVLRRMALNHPFLYEGDSVKESPAYDYDRAVSEHLLDPLPDAPSIPEEMRFSQHSLGELRGWVSSHASGAGLDHARTFDLVLAVNEIATNSVRHGGGEGRIRLWQEEHAVVCDVVDAGHIRQPLVGRELPGREQAHGRGLWLANQVCDLVQVRSSEDGTVVRLRQGISAPLLSD
jgi:anti-sigma regulatory factor (Ser/Thr protein kinase)